MFDGSHGVAATGATPAAAATSSPLSLPPKPSPCSTFIQADAASFKQVVQMLTGSTTAPASAENPAIRPRKPSFKLYERRGGLKNLKNQNSPSVSWRKTPEILQPSLTLSPVTPLIADPFGRSPRPAGADSAAGAAVAEKGFSMHPSPTMGKPPRLLPLFPVTSPPRVPSA
ncbi:VQ motif-containing protein 4-like [Curcuma longa]|uniref:VQ motif-containing protein 4-like n=1 Tax=Curcuma longa TaxID=136217 RepID=UPI003D9E3097